MEDRAKAARESVRMAAAPELSKDEIRKAQRAHEDLVMMGMPRVNLLLTGRDGVVSTVLRNLGPGLSKPIVSWSPGEPLALPTADAAGTMVLHDVGSLRIEDQIQLLEWLSRAMGRTQVVSTSAAPLLPRVRAGAFIDTLYYRLNTVCLEMAD